MSVRNAKRAIRAFVDNKETASVIAKQIREIVAEINANKWPDNTNLTAFHTVGAVRCVPNWHLDREIMSHVVAAFLGRSTRAILMEHGVNASAPSEEVIELLVMTNELDSKILNKLIAN